MRLIVDKIKALSHIRQMTLTAMSGAENGEAARESGVQARCLGAQMRVLQDLLRDLCLHCPHHGYVGGVRCCEHPELDSRSIDGDGASEWCPR